MPKINTENLAEGFYFVKVDGEWTIYFWDGDAFFDTVNGQYSSCCNADFVEELGARIYLPDQDNIPLPRAWREKEGRGLVNYSVCDPTPKYVSIAKYDYDSQLIFNVSCLGCRSQLSGLSPWDQGTPFIVTCSKCETKQMVYPHQEKML